MKKMFLVLFAVLLISLANADTYASGNAICKTVVDGNGNATIDMSDPNCAQTLEYQQKKCEGASFFSNFFDCIGTSILGTIFKLIADAINWLINTIMSILLYTPDISLSKGDYDRILKIVQSLYALSIAGLGLYWIWGAKDVEGRMKAKIWSERLIALVIVEAAGFFLFGMALKLNSYISSSVLSNTLPVQDIGSGIGTIAAVIIVYLLLLTPLALTAIVLVLRQILVFAMLMMFPFTLMLYLTPPTRQWGAFALNITLVVIFIGAVDTIIIFSASGVSHMAEFFAIDSIIRPIAIIGVFALLGPLDIWLFMNTIHMTSFAPTVINAGMNRMPSQGSGQPANPYAGVPSLEYDSSSRIQMASHLNGFENVQFERSSNLRKR